MKEESNEQQVSKQLIEALKQAIDLRNPQTLYGLAAENVNWEHPLIKISNRNQMQKEIDWFISFFQEPSLSLFHIDPSPSSPKKHTYEFNYQLSFSYPLPWRPRVIIPSKLTITLDPSSTSSSPHSIPKITHMKETWEVSPTDVLFKQIFPRFWDLYHTFPTPVPEYPPIRTLQPLNQRVKILELPETILYECTWRGLAKYPGPPLTVLPDFSFLTNRLVSRKKYYTTLPLEVQTAKYTDPTDGSKMKLSRWRCHVPTALREKIIAEGKLGVPFDLEGESILNNWEVPDEEPEEEEGEGGEGKKQDVALGEQGEEKGEGEIGLENIENEFAKLTTVLNMENLSVMDSLKNGYLRNDYELDKEIAQEYESKQKVTGIFKQIPRRVVASIEIPGKLSAEKISVAYQELQQLLSEASPVKINQQNYRMISATSEQGEEPPPDLSMLLFKVKSCWNPQGEMAMAFYENHFGLLRTKLFIPLEPTPSL